MNRRMSKRMLALIMICLLALGAQGLAESMAVMTANDNARVYDAQGNAIGALPAGTLLTLTGVRGRVCRVEKSGRTAYMLKTDLKAATETTTAPEPQPETETVMSVTAYVQATGAKVYNARGKVAGTLPLNTEVTVTAVRGGVCRITAGGRTGYMMKTDLGTQRAAETPAEPEPRTVAAYANKDGAKVVNMSGEVIAKLDLNTQVTVVAVRGSICQVTVDGKSGYMRAADLSRERTEVTEPEPTVVRVESTPGYVATDKAKVYDAGGEVITTLKLNTAVTVTAYNDTLVQIATGTVRGYMKKSDISSTPIDGATGSDYTEGARRSTGPVGGSTVAGAKGTAQAMDWWTSDIQRIFSRGTVAQITDVETGISWKEKRFGGYNHADCQPLTAADTAALKNVYGGVWTWDRRAIFVTIDGVNYAASMNGMPHGGQSITDNDFYGHHCIHFTNSRCHYNNKVDSGHQKAIRKAAAATLR